MVLFLELHQSSMSILIALKPETVFCRKNKFCAPSSNGIPIGKAGFVQVKVLELLNGLHANYFFIVEFLLRRAR